MTIFFALLSLAVLGWVGWSMYDDYRKTPGESLFTAFRNSTTLVGAKVIAALLAVAEAAQTLDPDLQTKFTGFLSSADPRFAGLAVLMFPLLFWALRLRSLATKE